MSRTPECTFRTRHGSRTPCGLRCRAWYPGTALDRNAAVKVSVAAAAAYAAAIVLVSWPLGPAAGSALADPARLNVPAAVWARADLDLLVWILAWVAHALRTQPWAIFQANIFHPAPDALASSEHLLGLAPIAAPVFWLTGNAVLTYNLTLFAVVWIAALGTFALVRAWSGSGGAGFFAGAAFAFAPLVTGAWIRLHVSAVHLFPLVLLFAWRVATTARARDVVVLAVLAAVQALSGAYVAFELAVLLAGFAPALWIAARHSGRSPLTVFATLGVAALATVPSVLPYLRVRASGQLPSFDSSLRMVTFGAPAPLDAVAALGAEVTWPVLGLAVAALFLRGRVPDTVKFGLGLAGLLGWILTVGPKLSIVPGSSLPSLYEIAMRVVPGFAGMRTSTRFLVLPILAASVLAGIACGRMVDAVTAAWPRSRGARITPVLVAALGVLLVVARPPRPPLPLVRIDVSGPDAAAYHWLREQKPGGAVLELPVASSPLDGGALAWTGRAMLGSTIHWKPLLNGYSGHPPHALQSIMTLAQRLPDAHAADALCDLTGLEWIVAHFAVMPGEEPRWATPDALALVEPVARFGSDAVFRLRRRCADHDTAAYARFVDPAADTTSAGTALRRLEPSATRVAIDADLPATMPPGRYAWVPIGIENRGSTSLAGLSAASPWTLLLRSRWRDATTNAVLIEGEAIPLAADVAPGERVRAQVNLLAPARAGTYVLEIGLVQQGAGWLADAPDGDAVLRRTIDVTGPGAPGA